jgi:mannose-1-phosphate guanylyltransferase
VKAVILVGGEGMRLRPLTCTIPKPMLPLVNVPFIEYIIRLLKSHGIDEIILSAGYLPSVFDEHLGDGDDLGMKINYVTEEEPLGTCGAVKNVEEYIDDTFIVFNGDILTSLNITQLIEFHQAKKAVATIALTSVDDPTQYGLVPLDVSGKVLEFLEKPSWDEVTTDLINAGVYVLEPEVLEHGPPRGGHCSFERELFPLLLEKEKKVYGFPSSAYWLDIGTPEKYLQAHRDILDGKIIFEFRGREVKRNVWAGEGTKIAEDAVVFGPVVMGTNCDVRSDATIFSHTSLGDDCVVESGARLEDCVLFDGVRIGEGAVIRNSILGRGVRVGKKVHVEEEAILGDNTFVDEDNLLRKGIKIWPDTEIGKSKIRF